ncbi:hypothetical protein PILCRDRAFT_817849 [Piloderma croceum F 1598]|uniref:Sodium/calcium exchanger membrane region domain-containing protein n=1 Tax=Piloderma croceum (strain F 1598) TaxID=765440 RepID=A0A0C3FLQ8_PILCF|nr:hypothetical protein PILCRDRAFT_817849 [Piloderma croceum F 1598]
MDGSQSLKIMGRPNLAKRYLVELGYVKDDFDLSSDGGKECRPPAFPIEDQCAHVQKACATPKTFMSVHYLSKYYCTKPVLRPAVFAGLILWLIFLFSTLGISASDFFTPNLATLAQLLGLDENVAGVTFLAFGNGSPDVFSTFSAMRADSGSLAIGELLGAASFIVSCIVGSMCIIKPFRVHRKPFLRDVGFFTVAVSLLLAILWDGVIFSWEAGILIALYVVYVVVVVVGSWWERRQEHTRRVEAMIRAEYDDDEIPPPLSVFHDEEPYRDDRESPASSSMDTLAVPTPIRPRAISSPGPLRLDIQTDLPPRPHSRTHSRTPSPTPSPRLSQMPSFSLVGALEFRQVVASLQHQAATSSLNMFESPITPYAGGHYHLRPRSNTASREVDPWDVPLNERSPPPQLLVTPALSDEPEELDDDSIRPAIPSISRTPASPTTSDGDDEAQQYTPPTRRQRILHILGRTGHILCPSLHHFRSKSFLGKIASIFAAPAVLALTLTLPVMVTPYESSHAHEEKTQGSEGRLIDFEEEGIERALIAEEEVQEEMHEMKFNKWLMAAQCALGPLFCVGVLFAGARHIAWLMIAAAVAGLTVAIIVAVFADKGAHPSARMARCSMGFLVAIVWIMAIADEVVQVLQTFGFIFGLSDAIIGLTIFAVGNSLADLVANMSVAVFAPIMGFSACFGGPMLNILLGVGISGLYIIQQTSNPYHLQFTTTLIVSTIGLLALLVTTVIIVPLNGYFLTRNWGIFLIGSYTIIMGINVFVEVRG